ncbi:MAG: NAD(P)H-dependent oxidoreductase subunit E [Elusimicrobiota bacterium]
MSNFNPKLSKHEKNGKSMFVCDQTRTQLLPRLQEIQIKQGYISDRDMQELADELGLHPVEVYSIVTFYSFLSIKPKSRHIIRVSNCISCKMAGSEIILKEFENELGIKTGKTSQDNITLELTSCIGMCDQAPALIADDVVYSSVTRETVKKIVQNLRK